MRLTRVVTRNIGGLVDTDLDIPNQPLVALAGPNGTGKSKLLSCLLTPWTLSLPAPRDRTVESTIVISIGFDDSELDAIEAFDAQSGWHQGRPPSSVDITMNQHPLTGLTTIGPDEHIAAREALRNPNVLRLNPSLDLIYLPAERRLLPSGVTALDLSQLAKEVALQHLASARATANFGRLDDQEFESYAKALCVASSLPDENAEPGKINLEKAEWLRFKSAVNQLLFPKFLRDLTRQHPTDLQIGLPDGGSHAVQDLSSGERQALIIISRVFRAGRGHSLIAIDEPDAYLHPTLSARLVGALVAGTRSGSRLIVATHSPAILDGIPAEAIFRLSHSAPAQPVHSEDERLAMYREAGFRASALTQSSLLLVTEGDMDGLLLPILLPALGAAAIRTAGGRDQVLRTVDSLRDYDIPVFGVVDADVGAEALKPSLEANVHVWGAADIEGVLLSSDTFMRAAIEGGLMKAAYESITVIKTELTALLQSRREEAIAEIAQRQLRSMTNIQWPSPRGPQAGERLLALAGRLPQLDEGSITQALATAESQWEAAQPAPWKLVRGKWIANEFVRRATGFASTDAFLKAVVNRKPVVDEIVGMTSEIEALILK